MQKIEGKNKMNVRSEKFLCDAGYFAVTHFWGAKNESSWMRGNFWREIVA